jgi:hypothetical protein
MRVTVKQLKEALNKIDDENELNISCRNVPACWYKNEQVFKSAVRRYEDVHKSRE